MDKFVEITSTEGKGWIVNTSQIIAVERNRINCSTFYLTGDIRIDSSFKYETACSLLDIKRTF